MAKSVDAGDLKSPGRKAVLVQVQPRAPQQENIVREKMEVLNSMAETTSQTCYLLGGILYVPHYVRDTFVGPGHQEFNGILRNRNLFNRPVEKNKYALLSAGASPVVKMLFSRMLHPKK